LWWLVFSTPGINSRVLFIGSVSYRNHQACFRHFETRSCCSFFCANLCAV